jgi:hypothetical protein
MILVPTQNKKDYYILLASDEKLKLYLICPDCNSSIFISWSKYSRNSLPDEREIIIQRMRCCDCNVTHALLPAFLLGKIRHTNETIAPYIKQFVAQQTTISQLYKQPTDQQAPPELSTVYRWFKKLAHQCKQLLPLLQQQFNKCCPKSSFKSMLKDTNANSNNYQIQDLYNIAEQLIKLSQQCDHQGNLFLPIIFLNYFCWQKTGQPLLGGAKFNPD